MSDKTPKMTERKPSPQSVEKADKTQLKEIGGRKGPEPTRYGDWEKNGIISDF